MNSTSTFLRRIYDFNTIVLRGSKIFGRRQNPSGAYATVIPKWIVPLINSKPAHINGDGDTSRDLCYVDSVGHANLLAATTTNENALNKVCNVAAG